MKITSIIFALLFLILLGLGACQKEVEVEPLDKYVNYVLGQHIGRQTNYYYDKSAPPSRDTIDPDTIVVSKLSDSIIVVQGFNYQKELKYHSRSKDSVIFNSLYNNLYGSSSGAYLVYYLNNDKLAYSWDDERINIFSGGYDHKENRYFIEH